VKSTTAYGVGADTAAQLLINAGANPHRPHSEAAFAALVRGGAGNPGPVSALDVVNCTRPVRHLFLRLQPRTH
jgi:hypothetical protein